MKSIYKLLCLVAVLCTVQTILPMSRHTIAHKMAGPLHRSLHYIAKRFKKTRTGSKGSRLRSHHRRPQGPPQTFQGKKQLFAGRRQFRKQQGRLGFQPSQGKATTPDKVFMPKYTKQTENELKQQVIDLPSHMYASKATPGTMAQLRGWWYESAKPRIQNITTGARRWGQNVIHQTKKRLSPKTEKTASNIRTELHSIMQRANLTNTQREQLLRKLKPLNDKLADLRQKEIFYRLSSIVGSIGMVTGTAILLRELKQHFVRRLRTEIISAIETLSNERVINLNQILAFEYAQKEMESKKISMEDQNLMLIELIKQTRAQQLEPTEIEQLHNQLLAEHFAQFERHRKQAEAAEQQLEYFGAPY